MGTLAVSDLISTYSKFIKEAILEYAEKENISSIPEEQWSLLTIHVVIYCMEKSADSLLKSPECSDGDERRQETVEGEKCFEEGKYMGPEEIQSSAAPSKIMIDVNPLMNLMTEHQKQQQEFQEKTFKTLQDQLSHQHTQHEQRQQQQNKVFEQFLQQQQDFQSRLMADFMNHAEMQAALFCQALSNSKTEQPVHDDRGDVDKKDTSCSKPSSPETTYHTNTGHCSISGRDSAGKSGSFAHYEVTNRGKKPFQVFDCHKLGQEFCQFFYSRWNAQNSSHGQERPHWDTNIFWNDAIFSKAHDNSFEKYTGGECVSSKLLEMTQDQKLTFTPMPDSKRFKCVNSKHGLVVVAVTGVVTNNDNCSSVFNQIFGLINCPSTSNYKIKSIYLRVDKLDPLISRFPHVPPLQYTTEQLQKFKIDYVGSM